VSVSAAIFGVVSGLIVVTQGKQVYHIKDFDPHCIDPNVIRKKTVVEILGELGIPFVHFAADNAPAPSPVTC